MWEKTSFGFRLNCMIGVLLVVCSLAIISINAVLSRNALEAETREKTMPALSGEIAATVQIWIGDPAEALLTMGANPRLQSWLREGEDSEGLAYLSAIGQNFIHTYKTGGINLVVKDSNNFYEIIRTAEKRKDIDPYIDAWFFRFERMGQRTDINIHGPTDPVYAHMAFINARVEDEHGRFLGVLSTAFAAEDFINRIKETKLGEKGLSFIVRKNGEIILHADHTLLHTKLAALPGFSQIADALLARPEEAQATVNAQGERILVSGREIPILDAVVLTVANTSELFKEIDKAWQYSALAGLAVLLAGFLLSSFLVASFSRSLGKVLRFVDEVAAGKTVQPMEERGSKEMVDLSRSLNDMHMKLRQSNISLEEFQGILDGMDAYLYVTDPATDTILFANNRMREHFGAGELTGKVCWQVLQKGMDSRCSFCPVPSLEKGDTATVQWEEHNTVTGRYYSNADCLIDWAGHGKVHLRHSMDITNRKKAEEELKAQLDRQAMLAAMAQSFIAPESIADMLHTALRMIGEFTGASHSLIARYDNGKKNDSRLVLEYEWLNSGQDCSPIKGLVLPPAAHSLFNGGVTSGSAPYMSFSDISAYPALEFLARSGVKALLCFPLTVGNRTWGYLCLDDCRENRCWSDADIQLIQLVSSIISGALLRSETQEQLVRMSAIVESSPQYITYVDRQGRFQYANPGVEPILGYSPEELCSGDLSMIFSRTVLEWINDSIIPQIISNGKSSFELPVTRKDGSQRLLSFSAFTTMLGDIGIGAIGQDVTEKRKLENDLITAKEQAERSNHAKSDFLSRMSHEMRTPLNAIIGMTSIGRSAEDVEKKEYCLEKVENASIHLLGVINDILDMSKIEANKFELSPTEFIFEKMLLRIINVVQFRIDEKSQTLAVHVANDVPFSLVADDQRLGQVIANLLSNAVKFTPEGGKISLNVRKLAKENGLVELQLEISDTGIGISKEGQSRLFKSFEQADGGIARKFGGTGLGLAISRRIVEMMGGSIWVESEEGQGSSFIFTIKAKPGAIVRKQMLRKDINWNKVRILAVDDAPEVREYFLSLSQTIGVGCDVAESSDAALALLERNGSEAYSVIFADWLMPGMDGIELTRRIKQNYGDNIVVIMISSAEWREIAEDALAAGVNRFLPKPLFSSQILDCITECLGHDPRAVEPQGRKDERKNIFAGHRVLLAEDIEINREIVLSLLEETGLEIDCAEDGRQAVEMFQANPSLYELIFMDIHMPEVDGYEATRRIRKLAASESASIPIIAMTANVFREDIERCLAAGMNDHLGKPIELEAIIKKLHTHLKPRSQEQT